MRKHIPVTLKNPLRYHNTLDTNIMKNAAELKNDLSKNVSQ